jgi:long-chain acyl-CoA synthetase
MSTHLHALREASARADRRGRVAVTGGDGTLTFDQVCGHADRIAALLDAGHVPEGGVVALVLPNSPEFLAAFLGLVGRSCVTALVSPKFGEHELGDILSGLGPSALLTTPEMAGRILEMPSGRSFALSGSHALHREVRLLVRSGDATGVPPVLPATAALIKFSSGSTGTPKGICLTAANVLAEAETVTASLATGPGTRILAPVPLSHSYGFDLGVLPTLASGCTLHTTEAFVPRQIHRIVSDDEPTVFLGVPAMYRMLLTTPAGDRRPSPRCRMLSCTAPLTPDLIARFHETFGASICQHYGSSETGAVTLQEPAAAIERPASVGRTMGTVSVVIRGAGGEELPDGSEGEIVVRSDAVAHGYVMGRPAGPSPFEGRSYRMGDLGVRDRDGFLFVHGRLDDLINVGGNKVSPTEVARVLESSPAVREAGVVRMRDGYGEEAVYAVVVLDQPTTEAELIRYCRDRMADYKVPRRIDFRGTLPRGPTGKVRIVAPDAGHAAH